MSDWVHCNRCGWAMPAMATRPDKKYGLICKNTRSCAWRRGQKFAKRRTY